MSCSRTISAFHYGVPVQEFAQAVAQVPLLRSAPMQRMLFELGKQFVLREQVAAKADRSAAPVMKPGVSQPAASRSDADVEQARARFLKSPDDVKLAAA